MTWLERRRLKGRIVEGLRHGHPTLLVAPPSPGDPSVHGLRWRDERDHYRGAIQSALRGCTDEDWDFVRATLTDGLAGGRDE
jgi:hypothetical protein